MTRYKEAQRGLQSAEQQNADLLAHHVSMLHGPLSTGITMGAASLAGAIDGALGEKRSIGPVPVVALVGLGVSFLGLLSDDPDIGEGVAAVARGLAAGAVYEATRRKVLEYAHPDQYALLKQADAAIAAAAASPAPVAPKAP